MVRARTRGMTMTSRMMRAAAVTALLALFGAAPSIALNAYLHCKMADGDPQCKPGISFADAYAAGMNFIRKNNPYLRFPRRAADADVSGSVVLRFSLLADGTVDKESIIIRSSVPGQHEAAFNDSARAFIEQTVYGGNEIDGVPVAVFNIDVTIHFTLPD